MLVTTVWQVLQNKKMVNLNQILVNLNYIMVNLNQYGSRNSCADKAVIGCSGICKTLGESYDEGKMFRQKDGTATAKSAPGFGNVGRYGG